MFINVAHVKLNIDGSSITRSRFVLIAVLMSIS